MLTPSAPCFKINAFCASVNFDAFIVLHSSQPAKSEQKTLIPTPIDQYPRTQFRSPMDMMRHGWLISLFHA